jgi:hypothetical protein
LLLAGAHTAVYGHVRLWRLILSAPASLQELRDEFDIDVRVLGIMSSKRMLLSDTALDLSTWKQQFSECVITLCHVL